MSLGNLPSLKGKFAVGDLEDGFGCFHIKAINRKVSTCKFSVDGLRAYVPINGGLAGASAAFPNKHLYCNSCWDETI